MSISTTLLHHHSVELPEPPALLPALVAAGARLDVAQAMQAAYHRRACEFREQAQATILCACLKLTQLSSTCSQTFDETILSAFKKIYLQKLEAWISEGVTLLQERGPSVLRCRDDSGVQAKAARAFNHQYVPLLEHFFEETPFPTHADKRFLAKKSNMTYRQIHVWFQNRRNRTKKPLYRKHVSEGATIPLDTLIRKMGKFAVPRTTESDIPRCNLEASISSPDNIHNRAPPHAFPAAYPPSCEYDPFPKVPVFVAPEWPRRSVSLSRLPKQSVMDINELVEKFSRLNVWDDSLSRSRRKADKVAQDNSAATFAITIRPSPAPHPACVTTVATIPTPSKITLRSIPANAPSLHVFRPPNTGSPMMTLIPTIDHQRKISLLSRRVPSRLSFSHEVSRNRTTSATSSSRSSSLGFENPIPDTRFAYWPSSSSSTVTTPEASPSPLANSI